MKKIVAILIAALVLLAVSCGGGAGVKVSDDLGLVMPTVMFGEPLETDHISSELIFGNPKAIGVNSKGNIVVAGKNFNLSMYSADGAYIKDISSKGTGEGQWKYPKGLGITQNDEIVVCDSSLLKVLIFDAEGNFVKEFKSELLEDCGPMAVSASNKIYVSDDVNGILVFDMDGNYIETVIPKTDGGQTLDFGYVAVDDASGQILIADDGSGEIDVYGMDGTYVKTIGGLGPEIYQWAEDIEGLAFGAGYIFAIDEAAADRGAVKVFKVDGTYVTAFGKAGIYDGEFASTEGIAYDKLNNRIVISDEKNNRIQSFSLESLGL